MPSRKPNLMWRVRKPLHPDTRGTIQLQTVVRDLDNRIQWITVAHGDLNAIERLCHFLSEQRFELYPLTMPPTPEENALVSVRRVTPRKPPKRVQSDGHSPA